MSTKSTKKQEPASSTSTEGKRRKRFSAGRKKEVVLRLLRGESLEDVSREVGRPAYELAEWRDRALEALEASLRSRSSTPEVEALEEEKRRLQTKLGEVTMSNELLEERIKAMESGRPFGRRRRSKR